MKVNESVRVYVMCEENRDGAADSDVVLTKTEAG